MKTRAAYIMGTSHSGSTLLAFLLNAHPEIVSVGETSPSLKRNKDRDQLPCSCGETITSCEFWKEVFQEVTEKGFEFSPLNWVLSHYTDRRRRNLFLNKKANPVIDGLRKGLLFFQKSRIRERNKANLTAIQSILQKSNKKVFADASKNPGRLELLMKEPGLEFDLIWLVRDVRAFANSMKRKKKPVEESARHWRDLNSTMERIYRRFPESRKTIVRYEDLCRHPQTEMSKIFNFLNVTGFETPVDFKSAPHHIIGNRMRLNEIGKIILDDKWRVNLTPEEQKAALSIAGQWVDKFDYDSKS